MNYKITLAYEGKRYKGFRLAKGDEADKTIQGKLENILEKFYGEKVEVIGAVNTAPGVDAACQIAHYKTDHTAYTTGEIREYLETFLPEDIITYKVEEVEEQFHSQYKLHWITYQYRLWKKDAPRRPFKERHDVKVMDQVMDLDAMKKGADLLVGEHDFRAFTNNRKVKSPVKEIRELNIQETECEIILTITANQFLLNMERFLVGTLIEIGIGQKTPDTITKAFNSYSEKNVGHKTMAGGLLLLELEY